MVQAINYGLATRQERASKRLEYQASQQGKCHYCHKSLSVRPEQDKPIKWRLFPGGREFLKYPVHLHHSHDTGLTIGAVHAYCNAVLWQYEGE